MISIQTYNVEDLLTSFMREPAGSEERIQDCVCVCVCVCDQQKKRMLDEIAKIENRKLGDAWVAQWLSVCLWLRL